MSTFVRVLRPLSLLVAVVAVAVVAAPIANASERTSVPSNLCKLHIAAQLKALGVGTSCKPAPLAKGDAFTINEANWGSSLKIQVLTGLSATTFKQLLTGSWTPVSLGSFARGQFGATGRFYAVSAWANGVGLSITLTVAPTGKNKASKARFLALARAVIKQI